MSCSSGSRGCGDDRGEAIQGRPLSNMQWVCACDLGSVVAQQDSTGCSVVVLQYGTTHCVLLGWLR